MNRIVASIVAVILSFGFVAGVSAQQAQSSGEKVQAANIPESALQQFIQAEEKVSEIRTDYQQRLNQVVDQPERAQAVQLEAQEKMIEAVEDAGLAVPEFNQIAQLASSDPSLRQRIDRLR
jgi:TolA-binding protein